MKEVHTGRSAALANSIIPPVDIARSSDWMSSSVFNGFRLFLWTTRGVPSSLRLITFYNTS